jgi:hypothetical protein
MTRLALCVLLAAALGSITGCAKPERDATNVISPTGNDTLTDDKTDAETTPSAKYEEHEGDRYLYVTAVSEEQKKQGRAVGDVLQYRYLGEKDGMLTLEQVSESGSIIGLLQCSRDCRIMKFTSASGNVDRIPFAGDSVSGSAMADAINGLLEPAKAPPTPVVAKRIPAQFFGTWQARVTECGTGLDANVVNVAATTLSFYESNLDVVSVEILSPSRIKVTGPLTDEGDRTQTMSYTLNLSSNKLTVDDDGDKRSRCPS